MATPGCWSSFWNLLRSLVNQRRRPALRRSRRSLDALLLQNNPALATYDFGDGELEWDDDDVVPIGGALSLQDIAPVDPERLRGLRYAAYASPPPRQRYGATDAPTDGSMTDLLMRESYIEQRIQGVSELTGVEPHEILGSASSASDGGLDGGGIGDDGVPGAAPAEPAQSATCYRSALDA